MEHKEKNKGGRPRIDLDDKINGVLELMIQGIPMTKACKQVGIPLSTLQRRIHSDEETSKKFIIAKEIFWEMKFEEMLDVSENAIRNKDPDGKDGAPHPGHMRNYLDNMKWMLQRSLPKYRDKAQVDHVSSDGSMTPVSFDLSKIGTDDLKALISELKGKK